MTFELRPSSNAAFAERIRSAEARKQQDLERAERRPRVSDRKSAQARHMIELIHDEKALSLSFKEVWDLI